MPFVRVSRDKRGYEQIFLIDATARRGKVSRARVLYWFRTPPGVMVGREPFDEPVRRALEARYPDVMFDWDKLRKTAIPPPDVEPWRERRRVERAAKQAREAGERDEVEARPPGVEQAPTHLEPMRVSARPADESDEDAPADSEVLEVLGVPDVAEVWTADPLEPLERLEPLELVEPLEPLERLEPPEGAPLQAASSETAPTPAKQRHRRRRRGGRRRRPSAGPEGTPSKTPSDLTKEDEPPG